MDQIRIGIIGAGNRSELAEYWHKPTGRSIVVAAADLDDSALERFKCKVSSDAYLTRDYQKLLERKDIDAVAVLTPDFTHEEIASAAFQACKHVFCEKPLAITPAGCDQILAEWLDSGKEFMVGFNMRYMNLFRVMKDAVDSGIIGEVKAVWIRHFVGFGGDYYFHDWHSKKDNVTSLLLQKGSHDIDMLHWITGHYGKKVAAFGSLDYYGGDKSDDLQCPSCPDKSTCIEYQRQDYLDLGWAKQCAFRKEIDVEDNQVVIIELDNGIKATYTECHFTPDYWRNYTFIGTEGRIENLDDYSKVIVKLRDRSKKWNHLADQELLVKNGDGGHGGADPVLCNDFIDLVLHGKAPVASPLDGRMSVAVGCAAAKSLRQGGNLEMVEKMPADLARRMSGKYSDSDLMR